MKNIHNWPLEHWHIEVCSKCSLRCSRCSRQEVPEGLTNTDLTLEWFQNNFVDKILTDVRKITFCGDDGDPIYAKDFIPILKWLRKNNKQVQFVIVTNGSYKTTKWWSELADVLDSKDHIHFSLDGWDQQSNNIYRVNCNWESIIAGIKQLKMCDVYKTWAAIAFKFNEEKLDQMKQMAKTLGFDQWQLTMSTKFGKNYQSYPADDPLQPSDRYVAQGRFTRAFERLTDREWVDNCAKIFTQRFFDQDTSNDSIIPLCMIGNKGLYINAKGHFRPCCWTGLRYVHNKNIFNYINFDSSLAEVLDNPMWHKLFADMTFGEAPQECGEKCSKEKWNLEHATGW
tara:strand:- start:1766 stop:2788 length:1023 start_codon:yes stop_codon:yes gene_type:complete